MNRQTKLLVLQLVAFKQTTIAAIRSIVKGDDASLFVRIVKLNLRCLRFLQACRIPSRK